MIKKGKNKITYNTPILSCPNRLYPTASLPQQNTPTIGRVLLRFHRFRLIFPILPNLQVAIPHTHSSGGLMRANNRPPEALMPHTSLPINHIAFRWPVGHV